jgi:LysM repeat protein
MRSRMRDNPKPAAKPETVSVEEPAPAQPEPAVPDKPAEPEKIARDSILDYTVVSGDSVGLIAGKFGVSVDTILWENNLTAKSVISPGDTLRILPFTGVSYKVRSGDNLSKISKLFGIDADKIIAANKISDAASLQVGQTILIPDGQKLAAAASAPAPVVKAPAKTTATTTTKTTTTAPSSQTYAGVVWTSDALAQLNKIPAGVRPSVKKKISAYAAEHGITTITKAIFLSIQI